MKTAAASTQAVPPSPDLVFWQGLAETIRQRVAHHHVWECDRPRPLLDALILLSHLRADDFETAIWCHGAIVQAVKDDLQTYGWLDVWAHPILQPLVEFIEGHNLSHRDGKWVPSDHHQEWRYEDNGWRFYVDGIRL